MAHFEQLNFCLKVKSKFPEFFNNKKVLDVGSLDVNGNNRNLFWNCDYIGVDIAYGPNVDIVSLCHKLKFKKETFDVVICTECFEHDRYYCKSLRKIVKMLKKEGLLLFTCATTGRSEHGTINNEPDSSPFTSSIPTWNMYYKNLTIKDIKKIININLKFSKYEFEVNTEISDLYFWGIKKGTMI